MVSHSVDSIFFMTVEPPLLLISALSYIYRIIHSILRHSFCIFGRLCTYTPIITDGVAAFYSTFMRCIGVFYANILDAQLLFVTTVVVDLASRVRLAYTRSIFLLSISISASFI